MSLSLLISLLKTSFILFPPNLCFVVQFHWNCAGSWDVSPQYQPLYLRFWRAVLTNILIIAWHCTETMPKKKKSPSSSFLQHRCWVPCHLFLICSTIFWGDVVLPSKYTELSPEYPHGALLATVKAGWKKIVTEAVFHWKGTFQDKMFLGNVWRWVNLWLKNVELLQQQERLTLFQVSQVVQSQLVFVQLTFIFGQRMPCV